MPRCRARTDNGTGPLCKNKVRKPGDRCRFHHGMPEAPPRKPKPRSATHKKQRMASREVGNPNRTRTARQEQKNRERVEKAAQYCSEVIQDGWTETVAAKATDYVSEQTWHALFRSRKRNCKPLAKLAKDILAYKEKFHKMLGGILGWLLSLIGVNDAARNFAKELASRIPIPPIDAKATAIARGVQIAGIVVCVSSGEDLTRCQCFIDLALTETKTRVKKILVAATKDWVHLAEYPSNARAR